MKNLVNYLFFPFSLLLFTSCEVGNDLDTAPYADLEGSGTIEITVQNDPEYEKSLETLSLFMGEVFKDQDALNELFDFAKIEGNRNDIEYNLKKLFELNEGNSFRTKSAIVSAFKKSGEKLRTSDNIQDVDELIEFIKSNNIGLLAPYLAENFDPEEIDELTVSWWTQEIEDQNNITDPEGEGRTPAIKLDLAELKSNKLGF